jgi:TonB-linked SusC/RagA family outer membrane protein
MYMRMKNMKLIWLLVLAMSLQSLSGQQNSIQIKVTDMNGDPIEGARLNLSGLPGAVVLTDANGNGTLTTEPEGFLEITFRDMVKKIPVSGPGMEVSLGNSDRNLQLGFGFEKEAVRNTSSIDIVYFDDIMKSSHHNPEESLFGQLTGLAVLQNGGEPWNRRPDMFIRGRGTFNSSSMLVLVDGFERDLHTLAKEEIESISVLKDGAALAIYGQRGANGVLLVNTRKGEYNTFHVDVSLDRGMNMPFRTPGFLNAYDYARAVNEASALDGNPFPYSVWDLQDYQSGNLPGLFPDVDWFGETFGSYGATTNFNTSFRGGGKSVKYFVTLNYLNETGLFNHTTLDDRYDSQMKYDRFNFRTNLDIDLTNTTRFLINVAGNIDGQKEPGARVSGIMDALYSVPSAAFPVESVTGVWGGTEYYSNNPVALVSSTGLRQPHSRALNADGRIIQDLGDWLEGLSAEVALAYDNRVGYWENKLRGFLYESVALSRNASGAITDTIVARYGSDTDLTASDNFGGQRRHATVYGKLNYSKAWGLSELNTSLMFHQDKRVNDGQYNTFLHQNMVAFASYGFKERYFVDGVLSFSGSSILPAGGRFGFFPSLSAAWLVSREEFLRSNSLIDFLKARVSWGLSGNDIMAPNLYDQGYFSGGGYFFTDNNNNYGGIREGQLPTAGLTYEKASKFNVGADLEMMGRLHVVFDAFYELRSDILASAGGSVPP